MIGIIISLYTAYLVANSFSNPIQIGTIGLSMFLAVPLVLVFISLLTPAITWQTIQRTERKIFPRVYELIFKDYLFYLYLIEMIGFTFYSFWLILASKEATVAPGALCFWLFFLGVSFDLMVIFVRRLLKYSHHQFLLQCVEKKVARLVRKGNERDAFQWLETAIEAIARSIMRGDILIAKDCLYSMQHTCERFVLSASKEGALRPIGQSGPSLLDEVSSLCSYMCRRLDWLNQLALKHSLDPTNEDIVNALGRLSLFLAKYNLEVVKVPLLFAEHIGRTAVSLGKDELATQCCCSFSEVIKGFIKISQEKGVSRKQIIFIALKHLEELVSSIFKKNKNINPVLLMQPFAEIAQSVGEDSEIPDQEDIVNELKRILQNYGALDNVLAHSR